MPMLFSLSAQGEEPQGNTGFKLPGYMDNVVPPSPTAAQIVKYADTPVQYSLGLPDITIPIYTIKTRELEMPITLTYHASGIKVDEIPGPVGLGWSLNAGGAITKTIVGLADKDEYVNYRPYHRIFKRDQINPDNLMPDDMIDYLDGVIKNRQDSYYDRYNYSYNGNSGSFMMVHSGGYANSESYVMQQMTLNDDEVDFDEYGDEYIVDPYGNKYTYGAKENVKLVTQGSTNDMTSWMYGYDTTSSWHLTEIESCSGLDHITLNYKNEELEWTKHMLSHSRPYSRGVGDGYSMDHWSIGSETTVSSRMTYSDMKLIESITFDGGSVVFEYDNSHGGRLGGKKTQQHPENYNIPYKLSKISIIENRDTVKVFNMTHEIFGDGRTMLAAIDVVRPDTTGDDATLYDSYTFDYYNRYEMPAYYAQDLFGYYNKENDNPNLCHRVLFEGFDTDGSEALRRKYLFDGAVTYTLSEVVTRRGESIKTKTCYEYEPNKHTYDDDLFVGVRNLDIISEVNIGVRIKSISTYDNDICVKRRNFEYAESDCTINFSEIKRSHYFSRSQHFTTVPDGTFLGIYVSAKQTLTFSNNSTLPGAAPESATIYYNRVNEYITDGRNPANKVRVEYLYDCDASKAEQKFIDTSLCDPYEEVDGYSSGDGPGPIIPVPSSRVDIYPGWWTYVIIPYSIGHNGYPYYDVVSSREIGFYFKRKTPTFSNMTNKIIYKTQGSDYVKVEEEINTYKQFNKEDIFTGLYVKDLMSSGMVAGDEIMEMSGDSKIVELPNDCYYFDVYEEVSCWKLVSSRRVKYFDGASDGETNYFDVGDYNINGGSGTSGSTSGDGGSTGGNLENLGDGYNGSTGSSNLGGINGGSGGGFGEEDFGAGDPGGTLPWIGTPQKSETTRYNYIPGDEPNFLKTFQPRSVEYRVDGDEYLREYKYPSDFSGSVYTKMKNSNNIYTVVEESVTKNDAGRMSVRTNFKTLPGPNNTSFVKPYSRTRTVDNVQTDAYTVHNHDQYGNPACVSVNGMARTCYIWSYGGKHLLAEIRNATYEEVSAKVEQVTDTTIETITVDSNPSEYVSQIKSLRTDLPDAMVTVYEYEPMVGITAVTDPSGRTSTFHYDAAGRLNAVKDPDGSLIETYEFKNF